MPQKNKTIKFISFLLIISILLPSVLLSTPKQAKALLGVPVEDFITEVESFKNRVLNYFNLGSTVTNTATTLKDWAQTVLEQILKMIAKRLLAEMTQSTINWINSGFHGSPLFLENSDSFFKDIAKNEVRNLVDMIGYDTFNFPFGRETALNVISSYKRQLYDNSRYTLSKVINDPEFLVQYRNDFDYGGWNGFLINTQYPQNNYLGFEMIVKENLASRLEGTLKAPAEEVREKLQQGLGFLSPKTCETNPKYNNGMNEFVRPKQYKIPNQKRNPDGTWEDYSDYRKRVEEGEKKWKEENTCLREDGTSGLVATTPGSVAANQVFSALETPFLETALDGALGNSLAAIFDALLGKFLEVGLNSMSDAFGGGGGGGGRGGSDNWSYDDPLGDPVTLDDDTYVPGTSTGLDIPTNVSVRVGQTTSAPISGGSGEYRIKATPDSGVATAKIDTSGATGAKLSVTGVGAGTTEVKIGNSSGPELDTIIRIEVSALGALAIIPTNCTSTVSPDNACVSTRVSTTFSARIDGGTAPYSIRTPSDETIAITSFADNYIIISGVNAGETFVKIKDATGEEKRIDIKITSQEELNVQQEVSVAVGQEVTVTIDGGMKPYSIESVSGGGATVKISGTDSSKLIITGVAENQTTGVIIKDSSTPGKQTSITITTTDKPTTLKADPSTYISMHRNQTASVTISGGTPPYTMGLRSGDFRKLRSSSLVDGVLTVVANNEDRTTWVEINDSATPAAAITIDIYVRD